MATFRPYNNDYLTIMNYLREIWLATKTQHCWLPQRWEYAEHFVNHLHIERGADNWQRCIGLWGQDRRVVGGGIATITGFRGAIRLCQILWRHP